MRWVLANSIVRQVGNCDLLPQNFSSKDQRSIVRLLLTKGIEVHKVHQQMKAVYREYKPILTPVQEWLKRFREGRASVNNDTRHVQGHHVITSSYFLIAVSSLVL